MALLTRLFCTALLGAVAHAGGPSLEYQVKAAFLYNFARFTGWPPEAISRTSSLGICVLGNDPFGTALETTFRDKVVNSRPLSVKRIADASALGECHILFFGSGGASTLAAALRTAERTGILTVGEAPGFIEAGGMIEFVLAENKVRFRINPDAAQRAHIRLSAQLLQLAWVVRDPKPRGQ